MAQEDRLDVVCIIPWHPLYQYTAAHLTMEAETLKQQYSLKPYCTPMHRYLHARNAKYVRNLPSTVRDGCVRS
jgi:hypothetical protein